MNDGGYNWDAVAAIFAALIGLLAIFISAYTAWNVRQQTRAQVWPHLQIAWSDTRQSILALNPGVGPAIVRSVELKVDGKPERNWLQVFKALGLAKDNIRFRQSTLNGFVLSPGETYRFLVIPDQSNYERFAGLARRRMSIKTCFCSTLGDCWQTYTGPSAGYTGHRGDFAEGCSRVPEADEFHD